MELLRPTMTVGILGAAASRARLEEQALRMGLRVLVLQTQAITTRSSSVQVIRGDYQDPQVLQDFFDRCDLVVYNDSQLDLNVVSAITGAEKLVQGTEILDLVQDRYLEKCFLNDQKLNIGPFAVVVDEADLQKTVEEIGYPCILKPIQKDLSTNAEVVFHHEAELQAYQVPHGTFILEPFFEIQTEQVVFVSKDRSGAVQVYPFIQIQKASAQNLSATVQQTGTASLTAEIYDVAQTVAQNLNYQGLLAVNLCLTTTDLLYVEHLSLGTDFWGSIYQPTTGFSQEELFWRSVAGWPIPPVELQTNGSNLLVRPDQLDLATDLIQQNPTWHLNLNALVPQPYCGVITALDADFEQLQAAVAPTKSWEI
ncbi:ATP-grasp domain-containing protein [Lactobacillus sp. DCY120]|uniref:ATP-grasp domain-containing protein n=1 Tax=Bombilactobacillus apium TaxID=2675299 RepID=A0A850R2Y0_9LACO|nr:ATP-grasp domain-containing protein [Bombilactobacillus apium]NVY96710.1 ATP-grasp domain-containing protein [Bombilactobacillus apium]